MIEFLLCIDDTDTLDSIGTGTICEMIKDELQRLGYADCSWITRHQLLIHEDIPYTSHNSSMCFHGIAGKGTREDIIQTAVQVLERNSAQGSDPGLCVAFFDVLADRQALMLFGQNARKVVLSKEDAYAAAKKAGVHLSEHGGTGQGVIGALAGVGLRLGGSNGELKGAMKGIVGIRLTVSKLKELYPIHVVMATDGCSLEDESMIMIERPTKIIYQNHSYVLPVERIEDGWHALDKKEIRRMQLDISWNGSGPGMSVEGCSRFRPDVEEERIEEDVRDCFNCAYRRWTPIGIVCHENKK